MPESITAPSEGPSRATTWAERAVGWLKDRERAVLLAAVGFHLILLVGMTVQRAMPLLTGDSLLVRVVPVDPRDLFRGDYVILSYEFSRVPPQGVVGLSSDFARATASDWEGRTVYVTLVLEPDGRHWRTDQFSVHRPSSGKFLAGRLIGPGRIEFGIESYYVQEGRGREYEQAMRARTLAAEIAVTSDGQAALRGLRIE